MVKVLTKKERKTLIGKIEAAKKVIAAERDKLRDYLEELHAIVDSSDEAERSLEEVIDALSRFL